MWKGVKYREELSLNTKVRVKGTDHEAVIAKIVDTDEFGKKLHCLTYHIKPRDPKNGGGHWYFSHNFEKFTSE